MASLSSSLSSCVPHILSSPTLFYFDTLNFARMPPSGRGVIKAESGSTTAIGYAFPINNDYAHGGLVESSGKEVHLLMV